MMQINGINKNQIKSFLQQKKSSISTDQIIKGMEYLLQYGYQITHMIDCGASGVVMKFNDLENKKPVAIKQLTISNDNDLNKAIQEYQRVLQLNHPNIIQFNQQLYDEENEAFFIISQFCEQGNLYDYAKTKQLTYREILQLIQMIIEGVIYMHSQKIIHSDLKPQNILLNSENKVKICDLGLSKIIKGQNSKTANQGGTLEYMAPEQIQEDQLQPKSDIFSLGVLICFLCGVQFENNNQKILELKNGIIPIDNINIHQFKKILLLAQQMIRPKPLERISLISAQHEVDLLIQNNDYQGSSNKIYTFNNFVKIFSVFSLMISVFLLTQLKNEYQQEFDKKKIEYLRWKNGDLFKGYLKDGKMEQGVFYYNTQDIMEIYEGPFKNNKFHGYGTKTWVSNDRFVGIFENGEMKKGTFYYSPQSHQKIYEGEFIDDKFHGYGKMEFKNGDLYAGEFKNGESSGRGTYYYNPESIAIKYEGEFYENRIEGFGVTEYKVGAKFEGYYQDGYKVKGILYFHPNSFYKRYEGEFKDEMFDGYGTLEWDFGLVEKGQFKKGSFIG